MLATYRLTRQPAPGPAETGRQTTSAVRTTEAAPATIAQLGGRKDDHAVWRFTFRPRRRPADASAADP